MQTASASLRDTSGFSGVRFYRISHLRLAGGAYHLNDPRDRLALFGLIKAEKSHSTFKRREALRKLMLAEPF
ncbi:hypothetical protein EVAR_13431_1 [Eumeta japonica]|uniref:Uncharacterized protein n=1 Tax=Eumeta variegata TaxID=151549 RepID=A0A4C1V7K8_EUMVA|nr:hypothetical protein EVAR_13431_1 [Eumeta japonica]